jgi:tricorn protease
MKAFYLKRCLVWPNVKVEFISKLTTNPDERVKESMDNRTLLFTQTAAGYTNIFTIAADGTGGRKTYDWGKSNVNITLDHQMENTFT